MTITAELIDKDLMILQGKRQEYAQQMEMVKALSAQTDGAIATLQGMKEYLAKPDPDTLDAIPVQDIAEAVAGLGATVEIDPVAHAASVADIVVDANGKYVEKQNG